MSFSRIILRKNVVRTVAATLRRHGSDHGHHAPNMPPFGRLAPPKGSIAEQVELVWDDGVAPETCIDFDAPHISTQEVLLTMLAAFGFFGTLYTLIAWSDPVGSNPVAPRATVIPFQMLKAELGLSVEETSEEEEEDDE